MANAHRSNNEKMGFTVPARVKIPHVYLAVSAVEGRSTCRINAMFVIKLRDFPLVQDANARIIVEVTTKSPTGQNINSIA